MDDPKNHRRLPGRDWIDPLLLLFAVSGALALAYHFDLGKQATWYSGFGLFVGSSAVWMVIALRIRQRRYQRYLKGLSPAALKVHLDGELQRLRAMIGEEKYAKIEAEAEQRATARQREFDAILGGIEGDATSGAPDAAQRVEAGFERLRVHLQRPSADRR